MMLSSVIACWLLAQPPAELPESLTLDDAVTMLRERSPYMRAARATVEIVAADRVGAGVHPNPTLSYGGMVLAHGANTGAEWQHEVGVEQPLLIFGQMGLREQWADRNVDVQRAQVGEELAVRTLELQQSFVTLLAAQEEEALLRASLAEVERLALLVKGRRDAGEQSPYDVMRAELEVETVAVAVQRAAADAEIASAQVAQVLGFPGWRPKARGALAGDASLQTELEPLWQEALARRPSLQSTRAQVEAARASLDVAHRDAWPVPALTAGSMFTQRDDSVSVFFGLALPLPIFDRNQGAVARAMAEIDASEKRVEAEVAAARTELERAYQQYQREQQILAKVEERLLRPTSDLRRMAEEAYRGGNTTVLDLLDTVRSVREAQLVHVAQLRAVKVAEASLAFASGRLSEPRP